MLPDDSRTPPNRSAANGQVTDGPLSRRFAALLAQPMPEGPVAADPSSRHILALAERAAASNVTVLVTGASGVGKEVFARHLHACSPRAARPFVAVNCAALPEAMLEALLFGHARGAFTGAAEAAPGLFRAAHGGTLFLDELGELPLLLQAKLLRAVEQREVLPLGQTVPVPVDVRLIAATNRDLKDDVLSGRFRSDLYWRLAVFPLALPPLGERPLDVLPLAAALLQRAGDPRMLDEAALVLLQAHDWPGNVRELANVLERARILADGPLGVAHIFPDRVPAQPQAPLTEALRSREAQALRLALAETGGRRGDAARRLGISERTLRYKLAAEAGRPRAASAPRGRCAPSHAAGLPAVAGALLQ